MPQVTITDAPESGTVTTNTTDLVTYLDDEGIVSVTPVSGEIDASVANGRANELYPPSNCGEVVIAIRRFARARSHAALCCCC